MSEHCVAFDRDYPIGKVIEALGIHWAFVTGACDDCGYLPRCSSRSGFEFPHHAACMVKAREYESGQ